MDVNKIIEDVVYKDALDSFLRILEKDNVDIKPATIACQIYTQPDMAYNATLCTVRLSGIDSEGHLKMWDYSRLVHVT